MNAKNLPVKLALREFKYLLSRSLTLTCAPEETRVYKTYSKGSLVSKFPGTGRPELGVGGTLRIYAGLFGKTVDCRRARSVVFLQEGAYIPEETLVAYSKGKSCNTGFVQEIRILEITE